MPLSFNIKNKYTFSSFICQRSWDTTRHEAASPSWRIRQIRWLRLRCYYAKSVSPTRANIRARRPTLTRHLSPFTSSKVYILLFIVFCFCFLTYYSSPFIVTSFCLFVCFFNSYVINFCVNIIRWTTGCHAKQHWSFVAFDPLYSPVSSARICLARLPPSRLDHVIILNHHAWPVCETFAVELQEGSAWVEHLKLHFFFFSFFSELRSIDSVDISFHFPRSCRVFLTIMLASI